MKAKSVPTFDLQKECDANGDFLAWPCFLGLLTLVFVDMAKFGNS
jgi:hypothetical protein